jgi:hypothetical protein
MTIEARESLEDKVYDLYSELDMSDIQQMTNKELTDLINLKMVLRNDRPETIKYTKPAVLKWIKVNAVYEVRNDQLVFVETWRKNGIDSERIETCKTRVTYEGKQVSASLLKHYLVTGEWVKRMVKPSKPFKAVVYANGKSLHLGYFATLEERDAAIFAYKHRNNLNVSPNG